MPTKRQFSKESNGKPTLMGHEGQLKGNSLQVQYAQVPKEKAAPARGNIDAKFEDKITAVKNEKFRRQREHRNAEQGALKSSKPWPGRKATTVDELVKHMSNVPTYLQRTERADQLQDKALNVGVLEWGLLSRWTHQQKHELPRSHGASPSKTSRSVLFSPPSHVSASPSSRALESNQPPSVNSLQRCSLKSRQSSLVDKHSGEARYSPGSNSLVLSLLPGHGKDLYSENDGNFGGLRLSNMCLPSDSRIAASGSSVAHEMVEDEESRRKKEENHCSRRLFTDEGNNKRNFFNSENNDSMFNDLQQSNGMIGANFESLISSAVMEAESNGTRPPVGFLEDVGPPCEIPRIPYSCPLPFMASSEELGATRTDARNDFVGAAETRGENCNRNQSTISVSKKPAQSCARFNDTDGLPNCHLVSGLNRMSRSSSLKEESSARQPELITSVDKINGDKSASNKGRRSPLRRMLDPLLKPRQTSASGPITPSFVPKCHRSVNHDKQTLNLGGSASHNVQRRSVDAVINSNHQSEANMNQVSRVLLNSERYLLQERDSTTTRQALLQLAWKNGLPLFMLSYGDSDILAATVRRKGIPDNDGLESTYTVFTVEEPKKKGGAWIKAGNKNKKHQLVSNIVGEMKVSLCKSRCCHTKNHHLQREFVLFGSDLLPSPEESRDSHVSRELAAIINIVPQQAAETSHQSSSENSSHTSSAPIVCSCPPLENLQPTVRNASSGPPSVIAILPTGFHGASTSGQPSPLIERWKSGGACDCGGWDEGCMLSVLTNAPQQCNGDGFIQANQNLDGTQRFDLLAQGRLREHGHAFSMVSFKEGLYTVEFRSSIALLQAFAMCVAMLHGRSPSRPQVGAQALQMHAFLANHEPKTPTASRGRAPTSYVPHHPPLSPAGRA